MKQGQAINVCYKTCLEQEADQFVRYDAIAQGIISSLPAAPSDSGVTVNPLPADR